jgi:hypothetical protein
MALNCQEVVPVEKVSADEDTYTSRFERYLDANIVAATCCLPASCPSSTIGFCLCSLILINLLAADATSCEDTQQQRNSLGLQKDSSSCKRNPLSYSRSEHIIINRYKIKNGCH